MSEKCYYKILGIEQSADEKGIKSAYKRLALQFHPDRNIDDPVTASEKFKSVLEAYETLSDPQERQWYDDHRDEILGFDIDDNENSNAVNLWPFFNAACFDSFDDTDDNGFYKVYSEVLSRVADLDHVAAPSFGDSCTSDDDVKAFYNFWSNYTSNRRFAAPHKLSDAPDRRTKRAMEKANRSAQKGAKREWIERVRRLIATIRRRDPRVVAYTTRARQKAEEVRIRLAAEQNALEQRRQEVRQRWKEERESKLLDERAMRMKEYYGENEDEADAERQNRKRSSEEFECVACRKVFKSEAQWKNHEKSKKHQAQVAELRAILVREEALALRLMNTARIQDNGQDEEESEESDVSSSTNGIEYISDDADESKSIKSQSNELRVADGVNSDGTGSNADDSLSQNQPFTSSIRLLRKKNTREAKKSSKQLATLPPCTIEDEEVQATFPEAEVKPKKKPRRRKDKKLSSSTVDLKCSSCGVLFESKNELFAHLREFPSHAQAKR